MILVADDNPANQTLLSTLCRAGGFRSWIVADGAEAVHAVRSAQDFSLILMDVHMPVMDGITATRTLREDGCRLPIVAVTGDVSAATVAACTEAGADLVVAKPINVKEFQKLIAKYAAPVEAETSSAILADAFDAFHFAPA